MPETKYNPDNPIQRAAKLAGFIGDYSLKIAKGDANGSDWGTLAEWTAKLRHIAVGMRNAHENRG